MLIHAAFLGGVGLIVGSFLGLVSLRLPRGEDVVFDRSRCGGCGRTLKPWRMIPVLSWVLSRGRCSDCGATIPIRYPLIELGAGLIGVWAGLHSADFTLALMTGVLGWNLLIIALVDAEHFWLPDQLTLPLFVSGLLAAVLLYPGGLSAAFPAGVIRYRFAARPPAESFSHSAASPAPASDLSAGKICPKLSLQKNRKRMSTIFLI